MSGLPSTHIFVTHMKISRILPGAAGLIALTATIGFVDGRHETDAESISRSRITPVSTLTHAAVAEAFPGNQLDIKSGTPAYLVEIRRGNAVVDVLIDAVTGRILLS